MVSSASSAPSSSSSSSVSSSSSFLLTAPVPLFILYGSATGNAEDIAKSLAEQAKKQLQEANESVSGGRSRSSCAWNQVICAEGNQFKKTCLPLWENASKTAFGEGESSSSSLSSMNNILLVITSTTGNGDAPENIDRFVRYLKRSNTSSTTTTLLRRTLFAVLALGDTNYDQFCACGQLVDKKLRACGAKALQPVTCADEGTGCLEAVVEPWTAQILPKLQQQLWIWSASEADEDQDETPPPPPLVTETEPTKETNVTPDEKAQGKEEEKESSEVIPMTSATPTTNGSTRITTATASSPGVELVRAFLRSQKQQQPPQQPPPPPSNDNNNSNNNNNDKAGSDEDILFATKLASSLSSTSNAPPSPPPLVLCSCRTLPLEASSGDGTTTTAAAATTTASTTTNTTWSSCAVEESSEEESDDDEDDHDDSNGDNRPRRSYYRASRPYHSKICQARYLTLQTSTRAAQQVMTTQQQQQPLPPPLLKNDHKDDDPEEESLWLVSPRVRDIYNQQFPLLLVSSLDEDDEDENNKNLNDRSATTTTKEEAERNGKRVLELTLSLPNAPSSSSSSLWEYQPGDSIGLWVPNTTEAVNFGLEKLQGNDDESEIKRMRIQLKKNESDERPFFEGTVRQALTWQVDLSTPNPLQHASFWKRILSLYTTTTTTTTTTENQNFTEAQQQQHQQQQQQVEKEDYQALQLLWQAKQEWDAVASTGSNNNTTNDNKDDYYNKNLFATLIQEQRWTVLDLLQAFSSLPSKLLSSSNNNTNNKNKNTNNVLETLFAVVPPIPPRYYSVSSSPLTTPDQLTIALAVVDYYTPSLDWLWSSSSNGVKHHRHHRRRIHGLATTYLEHLASPFLAHGSGQETAARIPTIRIFPKPSTDFGLPPLLLSQWSNNNNNHNNSKTNLNVNDQSTTPQHAPLILVGPGTGIAPFVGFLRHLRALCTTTTNATTAMSTQPSQQQLLPQIHVFFGCRHEQHDYLYRDELAQLVQDGYITKLYTAFSRDVSTPAPTTTTTTTTTSVPNKRLKYVQDIMVQEKTVLQSLILEQGAYLYLCGDGNQMAKDVQRVLAEQVLVDGDEGGDDGRGDHHNNKVALSTAQDGYDYLRQMKESKRFVLDIWTS